MRTVRARAPVRPRRSKGDARLGIVVLAMAVAASGTAFAACEDSDTATTGDAAADAASPSDADASANPQPDAAVAPRGTRTLGVTLDLARENPLDPVRAAEDAGATVARIGWAWDEVEVPYDAGIGPPADDAGNAAPTTLYQPGLHVANLVLSAASFGAAVRLDALDVGGTRAPSDLAGLALDAPELLARYDRLEDYAFGQMPDLDVSTLLVASDVDRALADDSSRYEAFAAFVAHAAAHAKSIRPTIAVGFVVTAEGASNHPERLASAWAASDVVVLSNRGTDDAAHVSLSTSVVDEIGRALASAPTTKPVVLDVGFPSAAVCGSSEGIQADFVVPLFRFWDAQRARAATLFLESLDDPAPEHARAVAERQGRTDQPLLGMLGSLGLRDRTGREKPAYTVFAREAHLRGW